MVQDQVLHKCNITKKNKGKKIPQRGLGVAQLERLRLEEQNKLRNAASASLASSSSSVSHFQEDIYFHPSHNSPFSSSVSCSNWSRNISTWKQQLHQTSVPSMNSGSCYLPVIEPPSNQMFSSDNSSLVYIGDDREILGMKRPPFNSDTKANPLKWKFPPSSNLLKPNLMLPYGNDYLGLDFGSNISTYSARTCNNNKLKEDGKICHGAFLTLGISTSLPSSARHSQAVSVLLTPVQGNNDDCGLSLTHSQTVYSFVPEAESICGKPQQERTPPVNDALDLNLKL